MAQRGNLTTYGFAVREKTFLAKTVAAGGSARPLITQFGNLTTYGFTVRKKIFIAKKVAEVVAEEDVDESGGFYHYNMYAVREQMLREGEELEFILKSFFEVN